MRPSSCYDGFQRSQNGVNPLKAELNPICQLLALLGAHHIFHVSGLRVNKTDGNRKHKTLKIPRKLEIITRLENRKNRSVALAAHNVMCQRRMIQRNRKITCKYSGLYSYSLIIEHISLSAELTELYRSSSANQQLPRL